MSDEIKPGEKDLTKERDDACIPAAQEIIALIASQILPLGPITEDQRKEYFPLVELILTSLKKRNLKMSWMNYVWQLVFQGIQLPNDICMKSLDDSMERAATKLWTKDLKDVTMLDVDEVLIK